MAYLNGESSHLQRTDTVFPKPNGNYCSSFMHEYGHFVIEGTVVHLVDSAYHVYFFPVSFFYL